MIQTQQGVQTIYYELKVNVKAVQINEIILDFFHLILIPVHKKMCVKRECSGFNISLFQSSVRNSIISPLH